jgi:hypothetical protein
VLRRVGQRKTGPLRTRFQLCNRPASKRIWRIGPYYPECPHLLRSVALEDMRHALYGQPGGRHWDAETCGLRPCPWETNSGFTSHPLNFLVHAALYLHDARLQHYRLRHPLLMMNWPVPPLQQQSQSVPAPQQQSQWAPALQEQRRPLRSRPSPLWRLERPCCWLPAIARNR